MVGVKFPEFTVYYVKMLIRKIVHNLERQTDSKVNMADGHKVKCNAFFLLKQI